MTQQHGLPLAAVVDATEIYQPLALRRLPPPQQRSTSLLPTAASRSCCYLAFLEQKLVEVMEDPYIAADGFTYEADAIKGWLYSGHETSPMTNLTLDHCDLIPNYALYYAIQEWQQQP
nr:U-box domain-containing protein 32 [Ipomoea batatas]